jgi:anti-anti-sigma factor
LAELSIDTETRDGAIHIALAGELDLSRADDFLSALTDAEEEEPEVLVVDLRGVTFMDSTGLRLLLGALRRAERENRRFVVVQGQDQVRDLFRVAGLEDVFELVEEPP